MKPLEHAVVSYAAGGVKALPVGLAPDIGNLGLLGHSVWLPESDWRVLSSRIAHSPLLVVGLLSIDARRFWPYALHWVCDAATHPRHQWLWPFVRKPR